MSPSWAVNEDTGTGLLKLAPGWDRQRAAYQKVVHQIQAAGYQVSDHDAFHIHMDECTYYMLKRV